MDQDPPRGLSGPTAAERLRRHGPNELDGHRQRGWWATVREVVGEPLFLLLLGAGGVYLLMGDWHEALVLLGFVLVIMAVTVLQERRTDRALDTLRDLASPRALVVRDRVPTRIAGREVVCGDLLLLAEGDRVPADGWLLQAHELACDESLLSGESLAVPKTPRVRGAASGAAAAVAVDAAARVFAGTLVVRGQGLVRVDATGARTEMGRIGRSLAGIGLEASPLRTEVARLTRRLVGVGLVVCVALALAFWVLRGDALQALLAGIALAMSVLPQEFPVIMIVFFALGARRMAARQVLTRRLNAIETLGETTVLCVDKTGTLTQNRMAVAALCVGGETVDLRGLGDGPLPERCHELLEYAVLASEIEPHDPMEQAFHALAARHLVATEHLHPEWDLAREYELSPKLLAMSHLWRNGSGQHDVVAAKGAPEAVADLCHLPPGPRAAMAAQASRMADQGLRVLAVAKAHHPVDRDWPGLQHGFDFEWLGLVGLADPLRPQVPAAVAQCRRAGIRVVMITGDHPRTASAIAQQAGLDASACLTGAELDALDDADLARRVAEVHVFARVSPVQKLRLVQALKARGEVVAMTGDGVNDAPALKAAHIGIAMGQRGTDVAREAAALVLLNDDFGSIVDAVRLGRRTFANLRQAMIYTLAVHVPIVVLSLAPVLLGWPLVLWPIHIAFLELVIDPSCSVVFEAQRGGPDPMAVPPRSPQERLLAWGHLASAMAQGLVVGGAVLALYGWGLAQGWGEAAARAAAFVALVLGGAMLVLPNRRRDGAVQQVWRGLPAVAGWVFAATAGLLLLGLAWPPAREALRFAPLGPTQWGWAVAVGLGLLPLLAAISRGSARA